MENNIDKFLNDQLTAVEARAFRQAMAEDAELEFAVLQRQLELLIVEELDNRYWKKQLVAEETLARTTDELEQLITDELDRRYWSQRLDELETAEQQVDELENLVQEELDKRHWQQQLNELETEERLNDLVTEELDNHYWKGRLEEMEAEATNADQLEDLVNQQLDDDYWRQQLKKMAQAEDSATSTTDKSDQQQDPPKPKVVYKKPQRGRIIRLISYATAAAAVLFFGLFYLVPLLTDTGSVGPGDYDYNIKGRALNEVQVYQLEDLPGEWTTTFEQLENTYLRINLTIEPLNIMTLSADILNSLSEPMGESVTARGTWTIVGNNIELELNNDIKVPNSSMEARLTGAAVKIWLENKRLFREPLEIIDITDNSLILSYGKGEGVEWTRQ